MKDQEPKPTYTDAYIEAGHIPDCVQYLRKTLLLYDSIPLSSEFSECWRHLSCPRCTENYINSEVEKRIKEAIEVEHVNDVENEIKARLAKRLKEESLPTYYID